MQKCVALGASVTTEFKRKAFLVCISGFSLFLTGVQLEVILGTCPSHHCGPQNPDRPGHIFVGSVRLFCRLRGCVGCHCDGSAEAPTEHSWADAPQSQERSRCQPWARNFQHHHCPPQDAGSVHQLPQGTWSDLGGFRGAAQFSTELPTLPKMAMRQLPRGTRATLSRSQCACGCFPGYILVIPLTGWSVVVRRWSDSVSRGTAEKLEIEGIGESG